MAVSFAQIPSNLRVPLFYAELDNSRANTAASPFRALIIGQITSSGSGTANVPQLSQGGNDARAVGGPGSMLALMTDAYRRADSFGEVWYLPIADNGAGTAATGSVLFTAAPTAPGTFTLYVAGQRVQMQVTAGQTASALATALAAAITAMPDLPVTASASTATVTLTAKHKGAAAGDIDLTLNYRGLPGGEVLPAGLACTVTAMSGGATNPTLTTALANLADKAFDVIVFPYTDSSSLDAMKDFLSSRIGRWAWDKALYGHAFAAFRGTLSQCATLGTSRNDEHMSIMGFNGSPHPAYVWAADIAATASVSLRNDPARPLQTLALSTVLPPPIASRFTLSERNTLLWDGMSTFNVGDDGTVRLENVVTTYQLNASGVPDNSYLQVETLFTLASMMRSLKALITSKFARMKLVSDGTRIADQATVSPAVIRAELIAWYASLEGILVQDTKTFATGLVVERNATNPNRVDVLLDPLLVAGLRIFAVLNQFRLQS